MQALRFNNIPFGIVICFAAVRAIAFGRHS